MHDVLDKIRKLLNLAQNAAATPGEVEAALNRAAHLQAVHGLTDEAVRRHVTQQADGTTRIDAAAVVERELWTGKRVGRWEAWTGSAAARSVNCKTYHRSYPRCSIMCYGLPQDVAVAVELFTWAMQQGERLQRKYAVEACTTPRSPIGRSWRDGFCRGLHDSVERAQAAARASVELIAEPSNGTMALVPITVGALTVAKARAVDVYAKTRLNLTGGTRYRATGGSSYDDGRATGAAQSLSRGVVR